MGQDHVDTLHSLRGRLLGALGRGVPGRALPRGVAGICGEDTSLGGLLRSREAQGAGKVPNRKLVR